jgi:quercetin dioxygenase-like cupin family protein
MIYYKKNQVFETVDENTERCVVTHSDEIMAVRVHFKETTSEVELHHHFEEQVTDVVRGKLKFFVNDQEYFVESGDMLRFDSNVPHGCIVLERDSEVLDIFTPIRKDFL